MNKILKLASIISWCIGIIFTVIALFTMNRWISIPMVLFLIAGSVLNYIYTKRTYTAGDANDVDDKTDTQ